MKNSRAICLFACLLAVVLVSRIGHAGTISIPVGGAGQIEDNKYENSLAIIGPFSFMGTNAGSNGAYCGLNIPCSPFLEGDVGGYWTYKSYSGFADINIQIVSGPFTISSTCVNDPNSCINLDPWSAGPFPASFEGSVAGFGGDPITGTIAGTGTIDLTGGFADDPVVIYFNNVDFNFGGSAALTITPEPNSIFLVGSGMLALLGALSRRARAQRCR